MSSKVTGITVVNLKLSTLVVNHQFTVVNCQFIVLTAAVNHWFTADYSKTSSDEVWV